MLIKHTIKTYWQQMYSPHILKQVSTHLPGLLGASPTAVLIEHETGLSQRPSGRGGIANTLPLLGIYFRSFSP
jgi:hypothetical protein